MAVLVFSWFLARMLTSIWDLSAPIVVTAFSCLDAHCRIEFLVKPVAVEIVREEYVSVV